MKVTSYKLQVTRKFKRNRLATCNLQLATSSGFTLVEMLVALAVFMVVAVVAVAALLKIVDANRESQSLQSAINNVSFAMDDITRELRVGSTYDCDQTGAFTGSTISSTSCPLFTDNETNNPNAQSSIAFYSSDTTQNSSGVTCYLIHSYFFSPVSGGWTIEKAQQSAQSECGDSISVSGSGSNAYSPILDPSVVITAYSIKVSTGNPIVQPSVFLYISGYSGTTTAQRTYFDIQTTISERQ